MPSDTQRYRDAVHAMQTGVKADEASRGSAEPSTSLRVGVNVSMSDHAALVRLLVKKGLITMDEYMVAIANQMEEEVRSYEERLGVRLG